MENEANSSLVLITEWAAYAWNKHRKFNFGPDGPMINYMLYSSLEQLQDYADKHHGAVAARGTDLSKERRQREPE